MLTQTGFRADGDDEIEMKTSAYDRTSSLVKTLVFSAAIIVVGMYLIWLFSGREGVAMRTGTFGPHIGLLELANQSDDSPLPSIIDDDAAMNDPENETESELEFVDVLNIIKPAVNLLSTELASLSSDQFTTGNAIDHRGIRGNGVGGGGGGPWRQVDPIPIHRRWRFEYQARDRDDYRRQLAEVGVVIGAVAQEGPEITKLHLSEQTARIEHSGRRAESRSLYFGHRNPKLERWDRQIAETSGISTSGCLIVHFVDKPRQATLLEMELAAAQEAGRTEVDILRTTFEIVSTDGSYCYAIRDQQYRGAVALRPGD